MNKLSAFSLLELLIALAISVGLLFAAIPSLRHFFNENQATQTTNRIIAAIHYARSEAIQLQQVVTLCSSSDHKSCGGEWRDGQIIIDSKGQVLRVYPALAAGSNLRWQSNFGWNNYLRFSPTGSTLGQQGSFYYCATEDKTLFARAIVVQQSGRTRIENSSAANCTTLNKL